MRKFLLLISFFTCCSIKSQILNAYAKVNSYSGAVLTVTNVNQTAHTFTVGGKVILMQMQDDVIGANTSDVASFGNLSSISSAGLYEIGTIASRSPATGTPTTITLASTPVNTFHTGTNSSLQIISFRNMGANFTTTAAITGLAWDGNVGGVIAFEVTNTLTLNHPISADVIGFRKGLINTNAIAGSCLPSLYRTSANSEAFKGEGIYKSTDVNYTNARGKILNGGGGGNQHNAGGGGGGNYSKGGDGGFGYSCGSGVNASGGFGGIALSAYIAGNRIFMGGGGGGGGGQQNNTVGLDGGPGGGIILIKANTIATNTICSSAIKITANGGSTASCGNDGAGGGGAAGTIVLQVNNYSASSACPLTINANGGNGGSVGDGAEHGGGGGGGQGAVIYSTVQPTVNISTSTTNGLGGQNNSSGASYAGNGGGANNAGILSMGGPLPIELLSFTGEAEFSKVKLTWVTATEINNDYYVIERSADGISFTPLTKVKATGNTHNITAYETYDNDPLKGINYYRLKQTDTDGKYNYTHTISVEFRNDVTLTVFPNPAGIGESVYLLLDKPESSIIEISVYDLIGKQISTKTIRTEKSREMKVIDQEIAKGIYMIRIVADNTSITKKLIVD